MVLCPSRLNKVLILLITAISCYESPKQEKVSHAFEHLVQNLKVYNRIKI